MTTTEPPTHYVESESLSLDYKRRASSAHIAREMGLQLGDEIALSGTVYRITNIDEHSVLGMRISVLGRFVPYGPAVWNLDLRLPGWQLISRAVPLPPSPRKMDDVLIENSEFRKAVRTTVSVANDCADHLDSKDAGCTATELHHAGETVARELRTLATELRVFLQSTESYAVFRRFDAPSPLPHTKDPEP